MTTTCGMKPAAMREQVEMREWYKEVEALYTDAKWLFTVPLVAILELGATVSFAKETAGHAGRRRSRTHSAKQEPLQ